jgi:hypothetical protein
MFNTDLLSIVMTAPLALLMAFHNLFSSATSIVATGGQVLPQASDTHSYRYKLTLEVKVDSEIKRASNVVEISHVTKRFPEQHTNVVVRGQALYLDLGPGRDPLIALLDSPLKDSDSDKKFGSYEVSAWVDGNPAATLASDSRMKAGLAQNEFGMLVARGPKDLSPIDLPDLVTFSDINDPKTVRRVNPDNLAETLGKDVQWHRMTIEITSDPVSSGLEERLRWLSGYYDLNLDGQQTRHFGAGASVANSISGSEFVKGSRVK